MDCAQIPKERPILFQGAMVRALLDGTKTQTRRAVKGQMLANLGDLEHVPDWITAEVPHACPYGQPGDRLWVRETWVYDDYRLQQGPYVEVPGAREELFYRADNEQPFEAPEGKFWKPSIHMPRWASRILLEIVSVRVERLQGISEKDARAEGVTIEDRHMLGYCAGEFLPPSIRAYRDLWESINGAGSWDANPWVSVVEVKRIHADGDQVKNETGEKHGN